jgi:hypothetical protein
MRTPPLLLPTLLCAGLAFAHQLPRPLSVRLLEPGEGCLTGCVVPVRAEVDGSPLAQWRLSISDEEGTRLLAQGSGPVEAGTPIWSGELPWGPRTLSLSVIDGEEAGALNRRFCVAADQPAGWPLAPAPDAAGPAGMPEEAQGALLVLRRLKDRGELLLLGADGQSRPGWPLPLPHALFEADAGTRPLVIEDGPAAGVYLGGKGRLLKISLEGQILAQLAHGAVNAAPPVLHWQGPAQPRLLLIHPAGQDGVLRVYDEMLNPVELQSLPGQPLAALPPVLADWNADGIDDLLIVTRQDGDALVHFINGTGGGAELLLREAAFAPLALVAGDLRGLWRGEALLVGADGRLLAFDRDRLLWRAELAGGVLSAPALVDLDGDGEQEIVLCQSLQSGELKLRVLQGDGSNLPVLDGLELGSGNKAPLAPLWWQDEDGSTRLLAVAGTGAATEGLRLLEITLDGQVYDRGWRLPGAAAGPPRLVDLDGDGRLELAVADGHGHLALWPIDNSRPDAGHAYGDRGHRGNWLQPVAELPGDGAVLSGRVRIPGRLEAGGPMRLADLVLSGGELALSGDLALQGRLTVARDAVLELSGAAMGADSLRLDLEGTLRLVGGGSGPGHPPGQRRPETDWLNGLELRPNASAVLELQDCWITDRSEPFTLQQVQLLLTRTWWTAPAGLSLQGGGLVAGSSLLQAAGVALQLSEGATAHLDDCVLTSAGIGLLAQGGSVVMHGGMILTCETGLRLESGAQLLADSLHFQGNGHDLWLGNQAGGARLSDCGFVEPRLCAIVNGSEEPVDARHCYWDAESPNCGPVWREPMLDGPIRPLERPLAVVEIGAGPMVDGDEPLEWLPVVTTESGLPVRVEYRIYRLSEPWGPLPAEPAAVTSQTWWRDPHPGVSAFYRVTSTMGKPHRALTTPPDDQ